MNDYNLLYSTQAESAGVMIKNFSKIYLELQYR